MLLPSLNAASSGVSPPSEGRSSLLHAMGLMPIFTANGVDEDALALIGGLRAARCGIRARGGGVGSGRSWPLSPLGLGVRGARLAHRLARGDFGHRDFPPPAAFD